MQTYNTQLVITRDCSEDWPYNDGIVFKTLQPIVCGAACILNAQGFPAIFGLTQRILGSVMGTSGRPKVYILQWLPHPVAIEKILDPYRWPNLAVVRGLSQGYEDHAITTTTITAVHDYLVEIGLDTQLFTLVLGSFWFDDPAARKPAPTATALALLESKPRSKAKALQLKGNRVPELVLRIIFIGTADDCPCGSDDSFFKAARAQFHQIDSEPGPVHLVLCGFRLEVMASAAACRAHMWHDAETSKPTNATVITGISESALASDLMSLLFLAGKLDKDKDKTLLYQLYEIQCVVMVPPQVGKQGSLNRGKAVVIWNGPHRYVPMHHLLPLKAPGAGYIGTEEVQLPGLATFKKAGLIADADALDLRDIFPPPVRDPDDIYAADAPADCPPAQRDPVRTSSSGNLRGGREEPTRSPGTGRGDSGGSRGRGGRGGRGPTRSSQGTIDQYRAAFVPSSKPSTAIPEFIRPAAAGTHHRSVGPTSNGPPALPPQRSTLSPAASTSPDIPTAMDTGQRDIPISTEIVTRSNVSTQGGTMALPSDSAVQAILDMMSMQHSQTSANISAMRGELQTTVRHTEVLIDRASLQALGREIQADQEQVERESSQITNELGNTGIPPWYRTIQLGKLATLQHRNVALASRKTELEQRYHLLAASNESVVARPSSW
jgi:hypothetical protein